MVPKKFLGGQERQYSGIIDGFSKIIKNEGITGLFKGFFIMLLKKPINTTITWVLYETMKEYHKTGKEGPKN